MTKFWLLLESSTGLAGLMEPPAPGLARPAMLPGPPPPPPMNDLLNGEGVILPDPGAYDPGNGGDAPPADQEPPPDDTRGNGGPPPEPFPEPDPGQPPPDAPPPPPEDNGQ